MKLRASSTLALADTIHDGSSRNGRNQPRHGRMIFVALSHDAAADLIEPGGLEVLIASSISPIGNTLTRGRCRSCHVTAQDGGGGRRDALSRYGSLHE